MRPTQPSTTSPSRYDLVVVRGRRQPGRDQPARRRLRQHGPGPARRDPDRRRRRHRPRRRVRRAVRHRRAARARRTRRWSPASWSTSSAATSTCCVPGLDEIRGAHRSPRSTACCRGTRTSGSTPRTPSTSPVDGHPTARPRCGSPSYGCRGSSNFTDVDALGLEPGVDVVFASEARATGRRRPRRPARHPGDDRGPGLAARARARPGGARPRGRGQAGARHLRRLPDAGSADRRSRRGRGRRRRRRRRDSACST